MELKGNDLESHENECQYRLVHCLYEDCKDRVPYVNYMDHMENMHKDMDKKEGPTFNDNLIVRDDVFEKEIWRSWIRG